MANPAFFTSARSVKTHQAKSSVASSCHHIFNNEQRGLCTVSASISSLVRNGNKQRAYFHGNPVLPIRNIPTPTNSWLRGTSGLALRFHNSSFCSRTSAAGRSPRRGCSSWFGALFQDELASCWNSSEDARRLEGRLSSLLQEQKANI